MKRNYYFIFFLLFLFSSINSFSQDTNIDFDSIPEQSTELLYETVYVINSFDFEIKGMTRRFALILAGELYIGEELTGLEALEEYVKNKTQILFNQRMLESVEIEYTIGDIQEDGKYPVSLLIRTKDSWNIIAIPRPQYSSNTGFDITIKARDYNFLGTMSPLRIDLGYQYDENQRTFFNLMTDSQTPFSLFNLTWYFSFYNYLEYSPDMPEPWFYRNRIGLSIEIPISKTTLTIGFNESLFYNEPNSERNIELYLLPEMMEGIYLQSRPYISWKLPTGLAINRYGEIIYTPNLSFTINHELPQWPLDETRQNPSFNFNNRITFGRIDWIGNFLNGLSFNASHTYNAFLNSEDYNHRISLNTIFHKNFENHFGISGRLMYRQWFNYEYGHESAGDVMRGIIDKDVVADYMFSFNFDLKLALIHFRPSEFLNTSNFRIFDFDFHLAPFLDGAVYRSSINEAKYPNADFSFKNLLFSTGLEIIIFPKFFRSLFLRASLGFNTSTLTGLSSREIYIGTELHY